VEGDGAMGPRSQLIAALLLAQLIVFVISLPGFGVETRSFTQYASWAGPVFLVLTLLVFGLGILGLLFLRRREGRGAWAAIGMALSAAAAVLLDLSHVGGPPPPPGPLVLSAVALVLSALLLFAGGRVVMAARAAPAVST
jgi:peptidoglycan/LPS O-acetylase OafA/YrhL